MAYLAVVVKLLVEQWVAGSRNDETTTIPAGALGQRRLPPQMPEPEVGDG
jgi:hypothetical protein